MGAIFISYRRSDSQGEAGRLFDDLIRNFGASAVFMDVVAIDAGQDFRKAIEDSLGNCGVLLAMIGPGWLYAADEQGSRRLDSEADYVRLEIAAALRRDIPVVPVLIRGARVPRTEQLPADLADLAYRNAVELTHARWKSDMQIVVKALRPLVDDGPQTAGNVTPGLHLDDASLQRITDGLAIYIGLIAEVVVKRSLLGCSSAEELCGRVAAEIETSSERASFLTYVRGPLTPKA
jgi:TIR domain